MNTIRKRNFCVLFFLFFIFVFPVKPASVDDEEIPLQLAGGINIRKGSPYHEFLRKLEREKIEEEMRKIPRQLEIVLAEVFIPGVFIAGQPPPEETRVVVRLRDKNTGAFIIIPPETKIWFTVTDGEERKREDIIRLGFSEENPYRVEAPVSSVSFQGEKIIRFIEIKNPEDFLKEKYYLEVYISIK